MVTLAAIVAPACAATPRAFVADQRLEIVAPASMAVVAVPFSVSWTTSRTGDHGYAVFVDQAPVPPGHTLHDLADQQCKHEVGCPNETYLADRGVYTTTSNSVEVDALPVISGLVARASHPAHTVTVVALDAGGRRRGDAAWTAEFRG